MNIQYIPLSKLKHYEKNPRKIDKVQFQKLCNNIQADPDFFAMRPCLVTTIDDRYVIYAGNQRARAAKKIGLKEAPCIISENLNEETMKKRIVLDNLHHGEFDYEMLAADYDIPELIELGMTEKDMGIISEIEADKIEEEEKEEKPEQCKMCPKCGYEL